MPQPIASSLATILPLIRLNISNVAVLPIERVLIVARRPEAVPHFEAPSDVLMQITGERQDFNVNTGQGRVDNRWRPTCASPCVPASTPISRIETSTS